MRSAPTSFGLSTSSGMPVRTPGSISTCGTDGQYCSSITRTSCSTDGTVDSPAAPVSCSASSPISPSMVERQLVGGDLGFGTDPPVLHHFCVIAGAGDQADDGVGVADVDREEHGSIPPGQFVVLVRPDPGCPSMPAVAPMSIAMLSSSLVRAQPGGDQQAGRALGGAGPSIGSRTSR